MCSKFIIFALYISEMSNRTSYKSDTKKGTQLNKNTK